MSWVYHSIQEEWLMLWAYGGGQMTQQSCFGYNMLVSFIISSTHGFCSELYRYEPNKGNEGGIQGSILKGVQRSTQGDTQRGVQGGLYNVG